MFQQSIFYRQLGKNLYFHNVIYVVMTYIIAIVVSRCPMLSPVLGTSLIGRYLDQIQNIPGKIVFELSVKNLPQDPVTLEHSR